MPYLEKKKIPSRREMAGMDVGALVLLKQWDRMKVQDGVVYPVSKDPLSTHKRFQLVLPASLRAKALTGVHDLAGHQGRSRTLQLARQRFFWPRMERDIREYVKCCQRCILAKTPEPSARAPLENIRTSAPMELVCLDFWSAEDSKQHGRISRDGSLYKVGPCFPVRKSESKTNCEEAVGSCFLYLWFPNTHSYGSRDQL